MSYIDLGSIQFIDDDSRAKAVNIKGIICICIQNDYGYVRRFTLADDKKYRLCEISEVDGDHKRKYRLEIDLVESKV